MYNANSWSNKHSQHAITRPDNNTINVQNFARTGQCRTILQEVFIDRWLMFTQLYFSTDMVKTWTFLNEKQFIFILNQKIVVQSIRQRQDRQQSLLNWRHQSIKCCPRERPLQSLKSMNQGSKPLWPYTVLHASTVEPLNLKGHLGTEKNCPLWRGVLICEVGENRILSFGTEFWCP